MSGSPSPTPPWLLLLTAPLGRQVWLEQHWLPDCAWDSAAGGPWPLWGLQGGLEGRNAEVRVRLGGLDCLGEI